MSRKVKNVTYSLPVDLVDRFRDLADAGCLDSVSAGVREAMEQYAKKLEKQKLRQELEQAAKDPLFQADMKQVTEDFSPLDEEEMVRPKK